MALTDNLVAYWKLDGNSNDSVNSHNGTDTSVTYSNANGIINNGAGFNGSTSKILVPDSTDFTFGSADWGFSFWIKRTLIATREIFLGQSASSGATTTIAVAIEFQTNNTMRVLMGVSSVLVTATSIATFTDTNYHHIIVTRDSGTIRVYVDNVADVADTGIGASTINDSTANFGIGTGGDLTSLRLNGAMDEIAIRKGSKFTVTEVSQLWNGGAGLQHPFSTNNGNFFQFF